MIQCKTVIPTWKEAVCCRATCPDAFNGLVLWPMCWSSLPCRRVLCGMSYMQLVSTPHVVHNSTLDKNKSLLGDVMACLAMAENRS